jgi:hypothetical protein
VVVDEKKPVRDVVVDEKKPVMDVTPQRSRDVVASSSSSAAAAPISTLDTPDAKDIEAKQNDCGCIIL